MRQRPDALILIAIYEFVTAAMLLIVSCIVLPIALLITPFASNGFGQFIGRFLAIGASLTVVFGFAVASAIVGVGLLLLKEWARIGAILLAIPAIVFFPIWTVIAVLIIVYLAGEEGRALFLHSRRAALVAARNYREEANQNQTVFYPSATDEPTVSPPTWGPQQASANGATTQGRGWKNKAASAETDADVTWVESVPEVSGRESTGDDVNEPRVG